MLYMPYIVTEDVRILLNQWSLCSRFIIPPNEFFQNLQYQLKTKLKSMFDLKFIEADDLIQQMKTEIDKYPDHLIISLDRVYNNSDWSLETNRLSSDPDSMKVIGETARPGFPPLIEQIKCLPKKKPIILIDDGCFSGDSLEKIWNLLVENGYEVEKIIVGIVIKKKCAALKNKELAAIHPFDDAEDWVCERDFFAGVPLSGRTLGFLENGVAVPYLPETGISYFLPFGNPVVAASIPRAEAVEFSRLCMKLSISLWKEIEKISQKRIANCEIPRLPIGIEKNNDNFIDTLSRIMYQYFH